MPFSFDSLAQHFGEYLRPNKFGHLMSRETYAYPSRVPHQRMRREALGDDLWNKVSWMFHDDEHRRHSDAFLLYQRDLAMQNYDLSMSYFESLNAIDFESALAHMLLKARTLKPVERLSDWAGASGVYVMVFDKYKQCYVGQSGDISRRIRQHWTRSKPFDRLIHGTQYQSVFPVDEMRALDNTRIFAARSKNPQSLEQRTESAADPRFALNRMVGGEASPFLLFLTTASPRTRSLTPLALPATEVEVQEAWDDVERAINSNKAGDEVNVESLASMDMTIRSFIRDDGSTYIWSRRDFIRRAVISGALSVAEFVAFLGAIGESVLWPEEAASALDASNASNKR